jgi:hypothetical protein
MNESDLDYVKRKLGSGIFVLSRIADMTELNMTTLIRIRDEVTKSPGAITINLLKDYFMKSGN